MSKKTGCLSRLFSIVILLGLSIWAINTCSERTKQAELAEQNRRAALTPEQRAAEDRKAAEEKAKGELEERTRIRRIEAQQVLEEKRQSQTENRSIEYMLATINAGTYVPEDDITVTRFRYLLQALNDKTTNTKQQIADMSVSAVTALRDKYGRDVTLLAFMDAMNAMLPAGERADYAVRTALYMQELKR